MFNPHSRVGVLLFVFPRLRRGLFLLNSFGVLKRKIHKRIVLEYFEQILNFIILKIINNDGKFEMQKYYKIWKLIVAGL